MLVQQIPCGGNPLSTAALSPTGLSGLGRRGLGATRPAPIRCVQMGSQYSCISCGSGPNSACGSWWTWNPPYGAIIEASPSAPGPKGLRGCGDYIAESGAVSTSDLLGLLPAGRPCPCSRGVSGLTFDGTGLFGTGLFSSGMDYTQWGIAEYGALAVGGYILLSVFHTTKTASRAVRRKARAVARA